MDDGGMRYALSIALTYPLGLLMYFIPFGPWKHICSSLFGSMMLYFIFGDRWLHIPFTSVISYLMIIAFPRAITKTIVPLFAMTYCAYLHVFRQYYELNWDVSGSQMMLTIKLYSIAWNLWDGQELQKAKKDEDYPLSRATKSCSKFAITKIPSLLEFMGYCLNFSTAIVGPNYEFSTYKNICDGTFVMDYYNKFHTYPSRFKPVLIPFLTSLFFALYHFYLMPYFHYFSLTDDSKIPTIISEQRSILYQMMAFSVYKAKFYFVWKAVEGSSNIFYAGFEGLNEMDKIIGWGNSNNVDILRTESVQNSKAFSRDWNKKTAIWLNRYIYQRHNGNMLITFFVSALWHGFYPGYYITFFTLAFISFFEQIGRDRITPLFGNHLLYQFACIVYMKYVEIYTLTPFVMLSWEYSVEVLKQQYFFLHIFLITLYVLHKLF